MRRAACWRALGIDPTDDRKAIRQAYAARLKAMDIEADPAGYQALRDARDSALRHADGVGLRVQDQLEVLDASTEPGPEPAPAVDPTDEDRIAAEEVEELRQALMRDTDAIRSIVYRAREENRWLAQDEGDLVMAHFQALADNPLMGHVSILDQGSEIFAELIAVALPQSDFLIEPAATLFGWNQADQLSGDPDLLAVLDRRRDLAFAADLDDPNHEWHKAWCELRTPANEHSRRGWFVGRAKVQALLGAIRTRYPSLEHHLDSWRVDLWESVGQGGSRTAFFAVWLLLIVAHIWVRSCDSGPQTGSGDEPPALVQTGPIDAYDEWVRLIEALGGTGHAQELRAGNPVLYQWFLTNWNQAREQGDSSAVFQNRMRDLLGDHLSAAWAKAPADLLRRRAELERQTLARLSATPSQCASWHKGNGGQETRSYQAELRWLNGELLAGIDIRQPPAEPAATRSFSLPADIVDRAARKAGLGEQEMDQVLQLTGPADRLCRGREALLTALIEAPASRSTPVFRQMFGG